MPLTKIPLNMLDDTSGSLGFRNRIINGSMIFDQRNAGAAVTANGAFPTDRFYVEHSMDGAYSAQRDTSAPAGFINSLKFTTTTADSSLAAGQYIMLGQKIEGLNVADLAWGTASASSVTLSFWVRSSLTGTFSGSLRNSSGTRSYPFTYTISAADTWEQKTITIAGDQSGTWLTTNGIGIDVDFSLGCGTTFSGTANAWAGANKVAVTGAVSVIGTLNATFYITGVQLEKGSTATSFDYRPYGTELQLCQRYFWKTLAANNYPGSWSGGGGNVSVYIKHPVTMRSGPSASLSGTVAFYSYTVSDASSLTYSSVANDTDATRLYCTTTGAGASANGLIGHTYNTGSILLSSEL